jgi:hypothetical protein
MKQLSKMISEHPTPSQTNDKGGDDDDIFTKDEVNDDQQAHIRRRAPTRHSIKSLSGRKTLTRQTSTEVKGIFLLPFFFCCTFTYLITLLIT